MEKQTFYAHGKLLLTAEYFILDGAVGLALPTKLGQSLSIQSSESNEGHGKVTMQTALFGLMLNYA